MASNLVFVWLGSVAPSVPALTAAIVVENITGGIATVIFVAYISALCGAKAHTATQYALLTALVAVGRTVLASTSGYGVAALGWPLFFLATAAAALPGLALLAWLQRRGHFASLDPRE
jgi:PAT family beta-lactamase induction signal transducer AmpG